MKFRTSEWGALVIVMISFLVGWYLYPKLPEQVVSHWNAQGQPDGYIGKMWGAFLLPVVMMVLWFVLLLFPRIDPKGQNIQQFRTNFDRFILVLFLFFLYIYFLTLWWNLGSQFRFVRMIVPAFVLLEYEMGVLIGYAKPNWSIGIRTPWTLSSDTVWEKTHQLGSRLFKISAMIGLIGFFIPYLALWFVLVPLIGSVVYLFYFSYDQYRKQQTHHS